MPNDHLGVLTTSAELEEIITFELNVKRAEVLNVELEETPKQFEVQPTYNLTTLTKSDGSGFLIRLALEATLPTGHLRCEVGSLYKLNSRLGFELTSLDLIEYANEVAVMTLLPFLRQHVADLSQRALGFPLIMPIMSRGSLIFNLNQ